MPDFAYTAMDSAGGETRGRMAAADPSQLAAQLRQRGLFPTAVMALGTPVSAGGSRWSGRLEWGGGVRARELAVFTRQLGTLLRAGMPLLRALDALGRQQRNVRLQRVIASLGDGIRTGDTLSAALAGHPAVFDRLFISMVRAGEAGGMLEAVLDRLARFQEKSLQLRGKLAAAMIYPAVVLGVAVAILAGLLVFVVPRFQQIFADLLKGAPLPPLTRLVLAASDGVRQHFPVVLVLAVATGLAFRAFRRTERGALATDALFLRLPLFGALLQQSVIARFSRTLGTLLASGVPILPALLIARDTCGNRRVARAILQVHDHVKAGAPVARSLEDTGVFPPMVTSMVDVGEHSGQLPEMLGKIADIYEEEVDNTVAGLGALLEPFLILFLALVVGTIVIALFLPIVRIVQLLT